MATRDGTFVWYELTTPDAEAARAFYAAVAGWHVADAGEPGTRCGVASLGGRPVAGIMDPPAGRERVPTAWIGHIGVADVDAMAQRVSEAGGTVSDGPHPVPGGSWVAMASDPQGARFGLTGPRPA